MSRTWEADFVAYYRARGRSLRRTAYLLSGDWHAAEDLVQATFVKLYTRWRRVRAESMDAYARKVLISTFLSGRRKKSGGEIPVSAVPDRAAPGSKIDDRLVLVEALRTLPRRQRAVLVLRYWEDLSVAETAGLLDMAEGTVKSHASRGVASLRRLIDEPAESARPVGTERTQ